MWAGQQRARPSPHFCGELCCMRMAMVPGAKVGDCLVMMNREGAAGLGGDAAAAAGAGDGRRGVGSGADCQWQQCRGLMRLRSLPGYAALCCLRLQAAVDSDALVASTYPGTAARRPPAAVPAGGRRRRQLPAPAWRRSWPRPWRGFRNTAQEQGGAASLRVSGRNR